MKCCFKSLSSFSLSLSLSLSSLLFTEACFTALVIQVAFCPKFHQFLYFGLRFLSGHQFLLLVEANSRSWQWEEQSSPSLDFRPQHESHLEFQNPAWNASSGWNSPELRTRQTGGGGSFCTGPSTGMEQNSKPCNDVYHKYNLLRLFHLND